MNPGWLAEAQREGISIFGAGGFARDVAEAAKGLGIRVHAFLVSGEPPQKVSGGIPVHRADAKELGRAPTWIGVFNREAHSDYSAIRNLLEALNPGARLVWPQQYYASLAGPLGWRFWLHTAGDYPVMEAELRVARSLLEDADSRAAYDAVVSFRRQLDDNWVSPQPGEDLQYLPQWLRAELHEPLRMVDGGAYHGETLRTFMTEVPVQEAWTFEPDPQNYAALLRETRDLNLPVTNVPAGLSDKATMTAFATGLGEGGNFSAAGNVQVAVVALDDCLHRAHPNFLKMDVEGHEMAALAGARRTLLRERPVLAIAGYHRWDDLWRIPQFIDNLGLGYRLRFSLHAHNSFEAVFYAY